MENMKVIILGHAKPFDFKTDAGDQLKGVKISYINAVPSIQPGTKGFLPLQESLDPIALNDIKELPGVYEVTYAMRPGAGNKPVACMASLKFIKPFEIKVS